MVILVEKGENTKMIKTKIKTAITTATFLSAALVTGFTAVATAEEVNNRLDVLIYAREGGNAWRNGVMINEALIAQGYESEIVHTGNCFNTLDYMSQETEIPTIFLLPDIHLVENAPLGCENSPTEDTFVTAFYNRVQVMCVRADEEFVDVNSWLEGRERVTVADSSAATQDFYDALTELTGVEFVQVSYDGSGATLRGFIAGDTDLIYTGYTQREASSEDINCFGQSGSEEIHGIPPFTEVFPDWGWATQGALHVINGFNLSPEFKELVREDILDILANDPSITEYISASGMESGLNLTDLTVEDYHSSVASWRGQLED